MLLSISCYFPSFLLYSHSLLFLCYLSFCLSACLSVCLFFSQSVSQSVCLSVYLSICLPVLLSLSLCFCLCLSLSPSLPLSLTYTHTHSMCMSVSQTLCIVLNICSLHFQPKKYEYSLTIFPLSSTFSYLFHLVATILYCVND